MKSRTGFVSNSSTSSFCIYGTIIEDPEQFILDKLREHEAETIAWSQEYEKTNEYWKHSDDIEEIAESLQADGLYDIFGWLDGPPCFRDIDCLEIEFPYEGDCGAFVGLSYEGLQDNETGAQFKARAQTAIEKFFGPGHQYGWHLEAWRDG